MGLFGTTSTFASTPAQIAAAIPAQQPQTQQEQTQQEQPVQTKPPEQVAQTFSKQPVANGQYIGVYQGQYVLTDAQGVVIGSADQFLSDVDAPVRNFVQVYGSGISAPISPRPIYEWLARGVDIGGTSNEAFAIRGLGDDISRQKQANASIQAQNQAYDAAARGNTLLLSEMGLTERYAQAKAGAPQYDAITGNYIVGTGAPTGPQQAIFDVTNAGAMRATALTPAGTELLKTQQTTAVLAAAQKANDINIQRADVLAPPSNPAVQRYNEYLASVNEPVAQGTPSEVLSHSSGFVDYQQVLSNTPQGGVFPTAENPKIVVTSSSGAKVMRTLTGNGGYSETTITPPQGKTSEWKFDYIPPNAPYLTPEGEAAIMASAKEKDIQYLQTSGVLGEGAKPDYVLKNLGSSSFEATAQKGIALIKEGKTKEGVALIGYSSDVAPELYQNIEITRNSTDANAPAFKLIPEQDYTKIYMGAGGLPVFDTSALTYGAQEVPAKVVEGKGGAAKGGWWIEPSYIGVPDVSALGGKTSASVVATPYGGQLAVSYSGLTMNPNIYGPVYDLSKDVMVPESILEQGRASAAKAKAEEFKTARAAAGFSEPSPYLWEGPFPSGAPKETGVEKVVSFFHTGLERTRLVNFEIGNTGIYPFKGISEFSTGQGDTLADTMSANLKPMVSGVPALGFGVDVGTAVVRYGGSLTALSIELPTIAGKTALGVAAIPAYAIESPDRFTKALPAIQQTAQSEIGSWRINPNPKYMGGFGSNIDININPNFLGGVIATLGIGAAMKSITPKPPKIEAVNSFSLLQKSEPAPSSVMDLVGPKGEQPIRGVSVKYPNYATGDTNLVWGEAASDARYIRAPTRPLALPEGELPEPVSGVTYRYTPAPNEATTPVSVTPRLTPFQQDYIVRGGQNPSILDPYYQQYNNLYPPSLEPPTPSTNLPALYNPTIKFSNNPNPVNINEIPSALGTTPMGDTLFMGQARGQLFAVEQPSAFQALQNKVVGWFNPARGLSVTEPPIGRTAYSASTPYAKFGLGDNLIWGQDQPLQLLARNPESSGAGYLKFSNTLYERPIGNSLQVIDDMTGNPALQKIKYGLYSPEGKLLASVDVSTSGLPEGEALFSELNSKVKYQSYGRELLKKVIQEKGIDVVRGNKFTTTKGASGASAFRDVAAELGYERVGTDANYHYVSRGQSLVPYQDTTPSTITSNLPEPKTSINWGEWKTKSEEYVSGTKPVEPPKPAGKLVGTYQVDFLTRKFNQPIEQTNPYTTSQFETQITGHANLFGKQSVLDRILGKSEPTSLDINQIQMSDIQKTQVGDLDLTIQRGVKSGVYSQMGSNAQIEAAQQQKLLSDRSYKVPKYTPSEPAQPPISVQGPSEIEISRSYTKGTLGGKPVESYGESINTLRVHTPAGEAQFSMGETSAITKGKLNNPIATEAVMIDVRGTGIRFGSAEPYMEGQYGPAPPAPETPAGPLKLGSQPKQLALPAVKPDFSTTTFGDMSVTPSFTPSLGFNVGGGVISLGGTIAPSAPSVGGAATATGGTYVFTSGGKLLQLYRTSEIPRGGETTTTTITENPLGGKVAPPPPVYRTYTSAIPQPPYQQTTPEFFSDVTMPPISSPALIGGSRVGLLSLVYQGGAQVGGQAAGQTQRANQVQQQQQYQVQVPAQLQLPKTTTKQLAIQDQMTSQAQRTSQATAQMTATDTLQRQPQLELTQLRTQTRTALDITSPPPPPPQKPEPPHVPVLWPPFVSVGRRKKKKLPPMKLPKFKLGKGYKTPPLADLISRTQTQLKYTTATSPSFIKRPSAIKYTKNLAGFIPTVEQITGGKGAKLRNWNWRL